MNHGDLRVSPFLQTFFETHTKSVSFEVIFLHILSEYAGFFVYSCCIVQQEELSFISHLYNRYKKEVTLFLTGV